MLRRFSTGGTWKFIRGMVNKTLSFFSRIGRPLFKEWPFILIFMVLIGYRAFKSLVSAFAGEERISLAIHSLLVVFLIAYLFGCVVYKLKKQWVKWMLILVAVLLFIIDIFLKAQFEMTMCPLVLSLIGETTVRESSEFFSEYILSKTGLITTICGLAFIPVFVLLERLNRNNKQRTDGWLQGLVGIVLCLVCVMALYHVPKYFSFFAKHDFEKLELWENSTRYRYKLDTMSRLAFSVYTLKYVAIETQKAIKTSKMTGLADVHTKEDSLHVVLVIGEAYNKYHSGLYGYNLNTTPLLTEEKEKGNLFVFQDAVSTWHMTSYTLKNLFSTNSIADKESWVKGVFFPALYKKAGFSVYNWDNQRSYSRNSLITFSLEAFLFSKELCEASYTAVNDRCFDYDDDLIKDFEKHHFKQDGNNLYVFHLMGQHVDVQERFPHTDDFMKFKPNDIVRKEAWLNDKKKAEIAIYDNATLYNDFVIRHVIEMFRNKNAVMVYLSDHGMELYDFRDFSGRSGGAADLAQYLKYQYEVPMMVWCSDEYMRLHPQVVESISRSLNKKFMSDNLCQLLFHISDLQSEYYRPSRDILSDSYIESDRLLGIHVNYDAVMRKQDVDHGTKGPNSNTRK